MRTLCIINQKGGVGKTTTAVNLASGLSRKGKRVLLVDMDPQGNIADSLVSTRSNSVYDLLKGNCSYVDCLTHLGTNLDFIHSDFTLSAFNKEYAHHENAMNMVGSLFGSISGYDYLIFDCAPSPGMLNQSIMRFCQECMIPIRATHLSRSGLSSMLKLVDTVNTVHSHSLQVRYIVPTHYDVRVKSQRETLKQFETDYPELLCKPIRTNSKLAEAPASGQSIFTYDKTSRGAKDYAKLVDAVVRHEDRPAAAEPISSRIQRLMADVKAED